MIGYYVHHHGSGHLHRAQAVASQWGDEITGLSTLPRPDGWGGEWLRLEPDVPATDDASTDVTAGGRLHWVPVGHDGLRRRMASLSSWIEDAQPSLLVSDVSVEVALLARLHGVKVVSVVLPGIRADPAHLLGYEISQSLVAVWPDGAGMRTGLPAHLSARIRCVGGLSRFAPAGKTFGLRDDRHVTVLWGKGGLGLPRDALEHARAQSPGWTWTVLGGEDWVPDPSSLVRSADVVLTHAGQNAIAETAAARRPAVVIPQSRPFREQHMMADTLRSSLWPAVVLDDFPDTGWSQVLDRAARLDGDDWEAWCDGHAADRFVEVLREASIA